MMQGNRIFWLTIFLALFGSPGSAANLFQAGQTIALKAHNPRGVPLHREAKPSFWKHVPDHTIGMVERVNQQNHWLYVILDSGEQGWVHPKYVRLAASESRDPADIPVPAATKPFSDNSEVWASRTQCEMIVNNGGRLVPVSTNSLRIGTWNLRWFPSGQSPSHSDPTAPKTDVLWVACAIAWMQLDVVVVQESLGTPQAAHAWDTIIESLHAATGHSWQWTPQPCGEPEGHHLGFLWNTDRVLLTQVQSLWSFNVKATSADTACKGGLRPGHYARVRSRDEGGVDFHLIGLHLKSGPTVDALEVRQKALNRIDHTVASFLDQDRDVIIVGDFNTMGAGDNASRRSELKYLRRMVTKEKPGFQDFPITPQCTHYFRGKGGWLDHILVSQDMKEVRVTFAQVSGYCSVAHCKNISGEYPPAYRHLSDHCPVILEIQNRDED